ncbi:MAG: hypothetical protein LUI09_00400 [Prevotellaceae bacterium]|nr:hypothetical protein [Prevotellaceae bacterium]
MIIIKRHTNTRISCHRRTLGFRPWLLLPPLLFSALLLSGCHESDDMAEASLPAAAAEGEATVRLTVSVAEAGDLNSTRTPSLSDADVTKDNEYINTLYIIVEDSATGLVERIIEPELTNAAGKVHQHSSSVTLSTGQKLIYAVANWDVLGARRTGPLRQLLSLHDGATLNNGALKVSLSDLASSIDPDAGNYIPMSGYSIVNITPANLDYTTEIGVWLDRLVDKVAIYIQGDKSLPEEGVQLSSLTFSGWADKTALYRDYYILDNGSISPVTNIPSGISFTGTKTFDVSDVTVSQSTADLLLGDKFYVNETYRSESDDEDINSTGYTITLQTASDGTYGKYDGVTYTSTTARQDLPRDKVYPISLSLTSYDLEIEEVNAWLAGTGTPELEYENDTSNPRTTEGSNLITLSEKTTKFTLKLKLVDTDGSEVDGVSWDWDYSVGDGLATSKADDGTLTASCTTASAGYTYPFKVVASWEETPEGGVTVKHSRTYNIVVEFDDIQYTLSE